MNKKYNIKKGILLAVFCVLYTLSYSHTKELDKYKYVWIMEQVNVDKYWKEDSLGWVKIVGDCDEAEEMKMTQDEAIAFIKSYYEDFKTGYSENGRYKKNSNNYVISSTACAFKMSFDKYDTYENKDINTIQFDWKDIEIIEFGFHEMIEIMGEDMNMGEPICSNLLFKMKKNVSAIYNNEPVKEFYIKTSLLLDVDITNTDIYKAFAVLKSSCDK